MTEKEKLKIEFILEFVLYLCLGNLETAFIFPILYVYICHLFWLCQRENIRDKILSLPWSCQVSSMDD